MAVLLTGSTGSVGHAILKALSNQGIQTVIIVRNLGARKLKLPANTIAIEGDICKTNAGIDQETINTLKTNGVTALIHSAGLVKFDNKFEPELVQTNVEGTKNVLSLADKLNVSHFHHISTAYVVGEHVNPYEKSKWLAEKCVEDFHIPYTIYRHTFYMEFLPLFLGNALETGSWVFPTDGKAINLALRSEMAEVLANGLENPEEHKDSTYEITSARAFVWFRSSAAERSSEAPPLFSPNSIFISP